MRVSALCWKVVCVHYRVVSEMGTISPPFRKGLLSLNSNAEKTRKKQRKTWLFFFYSCFFLKRLFLGMRTSQ
jgi:hypothetical protein